MYLYELPLPTLLFVLFFGNQHLPKFCQDHFDLKLGNDWNIQHQQLILQRQPMNFE